MRFVLKDLLAYCTLEPTQMPYGNVLSKRRLTFPQVVDHRDRDRRINDNVQAQRRYRPSLLPAKRSEHRYHMQKIDKPCRLPPWRRNEQRSYARVSLTVLSKIGSCNMHSAPVNRVYHAGRCIGGAYVS